MSEKLSWEQIKEKYPDEWVHLINYDWQDGDPYPEAGEVQIHAVGRSDFNKLLLAAERVPGAIVFVGKVVPDSYHYSSNLVRMTGD